MKNSLMIGLCVLLAFITSCTQQKEESSELGRFLAQCEEQNLFSGSVLIMEKGQVVFKGSYGYQNKELGIKNTHDTKYRAYSITKAFTATVVLQLIEEGKLSLSDKLSNFYPDYPYANEITIENLLGHTSGIPDVVDTDKTKDEATLMTFLSTFPLDFPPHSEWRYSNSNYYILGHIIKHITGKGYELAIEERILKPLGMTNSGFHYNDLQDPKKAMGYSFLSKENATPAMLYKTDQPFAAGAIYSTVGDLYSFSEALKNNTLIGKETMDLAIAPQMGSPYGLGYEVGTMLDAPKIGHSGGGPGFRSVMYRTIDEDITVIFIVNSENLPYAVTERIYASALKKTNEYPADVLKEDALKALEGIYSDGDTEFIVKVDDGVVLFNEKNTFKAPLLPMSATRYLLMNDFSLDFLNDSVVVTFPDGAIKRAAKRTDTFTWGIIGDATPNGWDGEDIVLEMVPNQPSVFQLLNYKMKKGAFQFRQNNDWVNTLSLSANGDVVPNGYNIEIEDGTYNIVLNLTNRISPSYSVELVGQ